MEYIRQLETLNIDVASEFILVAASLMRIKARMLIPRKEIDDAGNEIDPRQELTQRLLEYKRYKEILDEMQDLEDRRALQTPRGGSARELQMIANKALVDVELESLTLFKLLQTFKRLLDVQHKRDNKPVHKIFKYPYTIKSQQSFIVSKLKKGK